MKSPYLLDEGPGSGPICLVGFADRHASGRCQDRNCGRQSATLLNGYCLACATKHNVNPMLGSCPTIKLTEDAATAAPSAR